MSPSASPTTWCSRHRKASRYGPAASGRDVFTPATIEIGLVGLVLHGLRHTAASLSIAAGADVKVIQRMLGHKSATMTLDLYGHLFSDRLHEVADALDRAAASRATDRISAL